MKEKFKTALIIILIIIIILLLIYLLLGLANGMNRDKTSGIIDFDSEIENPLEYRISTFKEKRVEKEPVKDLRTITYSGAGKYIVDSDNPYIVLSNPSVNFVDMIFEITDLDNDIILIRTEKVCAGEYLYVNMYDFYSEIGTYHIGIDIASFDHENGEEKNGMHEEALVIVN